MAELPIEGSRKPSLQMPTSKPLSKYLYPFIQLYSFLSRRTNSGFNKVIHKRLNQSRLNRYPISISRIAKIVSKDKSKVEGRVVAVVGTVTNDVRLLNVP